MTCLDDDVVLGLVEGRLAPTVLATVDEHLDGCASCRDVVTQVARSLTTSPLLARGATVGRYVIGELVGEGAMGRVYSAWEPELDRRVALKLLTTSDGTARARMIREAKAMAKLDHPHVVGVYEVGTAADAVYVAMELVEGTTLRDHASSWRETAVVLADIARGLAAVHDAGVVHRDVKPDNIVIDRDHRARIADFGLARSGASASLAGEVFAAGSIESTALAGTPAYMAPEVTEGGSASPASDQFSFGVMAYEALAGARPFPAVTFAQLRAAYHATTIAPLRDVPAWLDAAIRRSLAIDPAKRFASLREFADAVTRGLAPRHRPRLLVGSAIAVALVASGATYVATHSPAAGPTCTADLGATWNAARRTSLTALGEPALRAIDAWTSAWSTERAATCQAHEPPATTIARNRCLDRRRDEMTALLDAFAPAPQTYGLVDTIASLPAPSECAAAALDPADPVPNAVTAVVMQLQRDMAAVRAKLAVGDARPLLDTSATLVEKARSAGHFPTLAEAELLRAEVLRASSQLDAAGAAVRDAAADAERGHADPLAARIWLVRVAIAGDRRDLASADDLISTASGAIDRVGAPPRLVATVEKQRALVAYNRGELDTARTLLAHAHTLVATSDDLASTVERIAIESALGSVERAAGHLDEAEKWHQQALTADRALRGDMHPDVARDLHNLAGVARLRGDLALAFDRYGQALAIEIQTRGDTSVEAGLTHNSLGLVALALATGAHTNDVLAAATGPSAKHSGAIDAKQLAEAERQFTLARDILTAANDGDRAFAEHNLGLVDAAAGKHREALAHFDAAAAIYASTVGPTSETAKQLVDDRAASVLALASVSQTDAPPPVTAPPTRTPGVDHPRSPVVAHPPSTTPGVEPPRSPAVSYPPSPSPVTAYPPSPTSVITPPPSPPPSIAAPPSSAPVVTQQSPRAPVVVAPPPTNAVPPPTTASPSKTPQQPEPAEARGCVRRQAALVTLVDSRWIFERKPSRANGHRCRSTSRTSVVAQPPRWGG